MRLMGLTQEVQMELMYICISPCKFSQGKFLPSIAKNFKIIYYLLAAFKI